jgi:hypothetical protein
VIRDTETTKVLPDGPGALRLLTMVGSPAVAVGANFCSLLCRHPHVPFRSASPRSFWSVSHTPVSGVCLTRRNHPHKKKKAPFPVPLFRIQVLFTFLFMRHLAVRLRNSCRLASWLSFTFRAGALVVVLVNPGIHSSNFNV